MNKQQLSEALAWYADMTYLDEKDAPMVAAARLVERLLPGECGNCHGDGHEHDHDWTVLDMACLVCHGSGQVWDEGMLEVLEAALIPHVESPSLGARAVLSALVELLTEKVP